MKKMDITENLITKISQLLMTAADETRLKILLCLLENKQLCVSEIQEAIGASQSLVSHQLQVLRKKKLVSTERVGNKIYYALDDDHVYRLIKVAYEHVTEDKNHD